MNETVLSNSCSIRGISKTDEEVFYSNTVITILEDPTPPCPYDCCLLLILFILFVILNSKIKINIVINNYY